MRKCYIIIVDKSEVYGSAATMISSKTDPANLSCSLEVLKRHDARVDQIVVSSGMATLYRFDNVPLTWAKTGFAGAFFVVEQKPPLHELGFVILNRQALDNFCIFLKTTFKFHRTSTTTPFSNSEDRVLIFSTSDELGTTFCYFCFLRLGRYPSPELISYLRGLRAFLSRAWIT